MITLVDPRPNSRALAVELSARPAKKQPTQKSVGITTLTPIQVQPEPAAKPKTSMTGRIIGNSVALQDAAIRRRKQALKMSQQQSKPVMCIRIVK